MNAKTPHYSLNVVIQWASEGTHRIKTGGKSVQIDIDELEYSPEEIADCICQLTPQHFNKTHDDYPDNRDGTKAKPDDSYIITHTKEDGRETDLFLKIRLDTKTVKISLQSFHQPRF